MIECILNGETAQALGVTVMHRTPVLALCRKLEEAGHGSEAMTVYRDGARVMVVSSIAAGAKRTVLENEKDGPRFVAHRPFPTLPVTQGMASEGGAATHVAETV